MQEVSGDGPVGVRVTEAKCGAGCVALLLPDECRAESHSQGDQEEEQAGFGE